jgi:two-component system, chemotaxis family, protein-glutamate methylesterase/glutaminase
MTSPAFRLPQATATGGRIRVMVVDDSVVVRHLLREALRGDEQLEFVGAAVNGADALAQIPTLKPDVITLDIEMPEMDGLETLRRIRKLYPRLRVIMVSTLTTRGAAATFEALSLGADDYLAKASGAGSLEKSLATLRAELIPKIKQFFVQRSAAPKLVSSPPRRPATHGIQRRVLGIGVSTGGPQALAALIPQIPAGFPLPILIVQHMPPTFTRLLAERLNALSPLEVTEAAEGSPVAPGRILIAPGDHHLRVHRTGLATFSASLDQGPHENSCRPSVDVLFRSLAENYGGGVVFTVLTGMGQDGLKGAEQLKTAGAYGIVQDEATSVVWGMPGAIATAGLADRVLPLSEIGSELVRRAAS